MTARGLIFCQACALLSDLEILEDGDQSEIGERGVCHLFLEHNCCHVLTKLRSTSPAVRRLEVSVMSILEGHPADACNQSPLPVQYTHVHPFCSSTTFSRLVGT